MKKSVINEFKDGINLDLHPIVTPNTVLTDNLNGTFITYDGNELCLQNDRGNTYTCNLSENFTPIGAKEHGGIIYIVSANGCQTEIGTYPGINWNETEGFLDYSKYTPLGNLYVDSNKIIPSEYGFRANIGFDITTPVTIEVQDSYDGSVNLIIIGGENKPIIVNSGFSVQPENKYKLIERNQNSDTNKYSIDKLSEQIGLIRTSDVITNIELHDYNSELHDYNSDDENYLLTGGQLKGGNYKFYIKFGDADYNQTDIVAESSGVISIFNGKNGIASTISGTLLDERTDKMIGLDIVGLNHTYSKIYVYYSREYSDTNGFRMTEYMMINDPIDMIEDVNESKQTIWLTGYEQEVPINPEELNVDYHTIDFAKAETQQANMLFLGNVGKDETTFNTYEALRDFTKKITVNAHFDLLDSESSETNDGQFDLYDWKLYYDVGNIYYKLGYYPGEMYRFGIVYVFNDGATSPVFNISGGEFVYNNGKFSLDRTYPSIGVTDQTLYEKGVVIMPKESSNGSVINRSDGSDNVSVIGLSFILPNTFDLLENGVKSWFVVRQKRIPNTICQGVSGKIDFKSHTPVIYDGDNWISQSFLSVDRINPIGGIVINDRETTLSYDNIAFNNKSGIMTQSEFEGQDSSNVQQIFVEKSGSSIQYRDFAENIRGKISPFPSNDKFNEFYAYQYGSREELIRHLAHPIATVYKTTYLLYADGIKVQLRKNTRVKDFKIYYYSISENPPSSITIDKIVTIDYNKKINRAAPLVIPDSINVNSNSGDIIEPSSEYMSYINKNGGSIKNKQMTSKLGSGEHPFSSDYLLSLDPCVNSTVQSMLNGSIFFVEKQYNVNIESDPDCGYYQYKPVGLNESDEHKQEERRLVFVNSDTSMKVVDSFAYSSIAGDFADASKFSYFTNWLLSIKSDGIDNRTDIDSYKHSNNVNLIRGKFCPYIGVTGESFPTDSIGVYSVKLKDNFTEQDIDVRANDNSEYYCVSNRFKIRIDEDTIGEEVVYGGDCYVCTSTIRIIRNFIDAEAPVSENILKPDCWQKEVIEKVYSIESNDPDPEKLVDFGEVNLSDVNTVDLGMWVTFRTLSNYNLGLRSQDRSHVDEIALLGSPRTFYPLNGASTATGAKMEESWLLNDGYNATVGRKRYNLLPDVPYTKSEFSNRIMFSNVNVTDAYTNGYRTFQGLSYKDYDKQYGEITKLISWGSNILCVMEHGIGLVSVNERALMQTTTGEAIHIYGHGVLPDNMTIISQDYGSKYPNSVIRTPIGVYGVDTDARKIWRFSDKQGFETISDMKIESYLNDNLFTDANSVIETIDVRTHYNAFKGDVMFTFYNTKKPYLIVPDEIDLYEGEERLYGIKTNIEDVTFDIDDSNIAELIMRNGNIYVKGKLVGSTKVNVKSKNYEPAITNKYLTNIPNEVSLSVGEELTFAFANPIDSSKLQITHGSRVEVSAHDTYFVISGLQEGKAKISFLYDSEYVTCSVVVKEESSVTPDYPTPVDPDVPTPSTNVEDVEYYTVTLSRPHLEYEYGARYAEDCNVYVTYKGNRTEYQFTGGRDTFQLELEKNASVTVECEVSNYIKYNKTVNISQNRMQIVPVLRSRVTLTIDSIVPSNAVVKVGNQTVTAGQSLTFVNGNYTCISAEADGYLPYEECFSLTSDKTMSVVLSEGDCYLNFQIDTVIYKPDGSYVSSFGAPSGSVIDYTIYRGSDTITGTVTGPISLSIPVKIGDKIEYTYTCPGYSGFSTKSAREITEPTTLKYHVEPNGYGSVALTNIPHGYKYAMINGDPVWIGQRLHFLNGTVLTITLMDDDRSFTYTVQEGENITLDVKSEIGDV